MREPRAPEQTECGGCAAANCALQRADLDGDLPGAEPLIECVLGASWKDGTRAAKESCANGELVSSCYCGSSPPEQCFVSPASAASGPCRSELLTATGCDSAAADSTCPALKALDPSNTSGRVLQYVQCQQDFCFAQCFNL